VELIDRSRRPIELTDAGAVRRSLTRTPAGQ
jgi:hypothetical protein